ncbi:MAG: DUF4785 domain-containing protein, partial [Acidobacteriota bacterium]
MSLSTTPSSIRPRFGLSSFTAALALLLLTAGASAQTTGGTGTTDATDATGTGTVTQLVTLAPAAADDFKSNVLIATAETPLAAVTTVPVVFHYAVAADAHIESKPAPHGATGHHYDQIVTADELRQGVTLHTTVDQPILWIQPSMASRVAGGGAELVVAPETWVIRRTDGSELSAGEALEWSGAEAGNLDVFPEGTSIARLKSTVGQGPLVLAAPSLSGDASYQVHVDEPSSAVGLHLVAAKAEHFHDEVATFTARLVGGTAASITSMAGHVFSPSGDVWPVQFLRERDGSFTGSHRIDALADLAPGPWTVHASAKGTDGTTVFERQVHTGFQVSLPTAELLNTVEVSTDATTSTFRFGVNAAAEGRYHVEGVIYGTSPTTGALVPAIAIQSADYFDQPGAGGVLEATVSLCGLAHLTPPFEIRDLRLMDQSRLSVVQRQRVGL